MTLAKGAQITDLRMFLTPVTYPHLNEVGRLVLAGVKVLRLLCVPPPA